MDSKTDMSQNTSPKITPQGKAIRAIVHDFNNSLAAIMVHADFLMDDLPEDSEQHLFAENIHKAGLQLEELMIRLKALSEEKD